MTQNTQEILNHLLETANLPFEKARSMPAGVYTDGGFLGLENDRLFKREWICVGRQDTLSKAGSYLTTQIAGEPVIVIRNESEQIKAYSNVCLHRLSLLKTGTGSCKRIVCPYHGWTYGINGKLVGAPHMDQSPAFDVSDYALPEIRCEVWLGWIYLTLAENAKPVSEQLASLEEKIQHYGMENYTETFHEEHTWDTNWKILAENFMESYHLPVLHRATVGPHSKIEDMQCPPGEPAYNYHWIRKEASLAIGNAHSQNTRLQGDWRQTTALICIYPSHLITLTPGYFWYLSLQPLATDKVHITFGGGLSPEFIDDPQGQEAMLQLKALLDKVNQEDRKGVESVFAGTKAQHANPGHLCFLERPNYDFAKYLVSKLIVENDG